MSSFREFRTAVQRQFQAMSTYHMFEVKIDKDTLWGAYLKAFPEGTNPMYKERTEHDCQSCKSFIRNAGAVVCVNSNNELVSIWDIKTDGFYQVVADKLSELVKAQVIDNIFLHSEASCGIDKSSQLLESKLTTWEHLYITLPGSVHIPGKDIGTKLGEARSTKDVFLRGLEEITVDSIETALELINQGSLYRGEEHKASLEGFLKVKREFDKLGPGQRDQFAWSYSRTLPHHITFLKNNVIGTLVVDMSKGEDLEKAVGSFEAKVAPTNYKRPKSLITQKMIEQAREKVKELGFESSLARRYAVMEDITIDNVLFADRDAKKSMSGDVFDTLAQAVPVSVKTLEKTEEVSIEKFISDILPNVSTIELLIENRHASNLVSLVAPDDPTAKTMFKWNNGYSWSYNGDLADSEIRRAVQARGGRVDGVFRFSHSWNHDKRNASLMDLHVFMPGHNMNKADGVHDNYGNGARVGWNNRTHHASGGTQDVDYTAPAPVGYVPVENITFPSLDKMPEGTYVCKIHNWNLRPPTQGGFRAELEFGGQLFQYSYDKPLGHKEWVTVAEVTLKDKQFTINHRLPESVQSRTMWGLTTQTFQRVSMVLLSPNHWDGNAVGNKHYFFMLDGVKNDSTARGFFNEFLSEELSPHRKVFEVVGSKMKTEESDRQLSGLGFSSTQRNNVLAKVTGKFTRTIRITI